MDGRIEWGFSVIGVVAAIPAVVVLVSGSDCPGVGVVPWFARVATALLLVVFIAAGVVFALAFGGLKPLSGLAWFGAVEVLSFLQTPGGVDLLSAGNWAVAVNLVSASIIGFLASKFPELVLGAAGAAMVVSEVVLVDSGLGCGSLAGSGATALGFVIAPFLVAFIGTKLLGNVLSR